MSSLQAISCHKHSSNCVVVKSLHRYTTACQTIKCVHHGSVEESFLDTKQQKLKYAHLSHMLKYGHIIVVSAHTAGLGDLTLRTHTSRVCDSGQALIATGSMDVSPRCTCIPTRNRAPETCKSQACFSAFHTLSLTLFHSWT